jgi:hypothetical protein
LEATQGDNLETLKIKMKPSTNIRTINGVNNYTKLGWKTRIGIEGTQFPNPRTYIARVAL